MHLSPALRPGSFRLRPRRLGRDAMTSHPLSHRLAQPLTANRHPLATPPRRQGRASLLDRGRPRTVSPTQCPQQSSGLRFPFEPCFSLFNRASEPPCLALLAPMPTCQLVNGPASCSRAHLCTFAFSASQQFPSRLRRASELLPFDSATLACPHTQASHIY
jgi:hypothetical protein